MDSNRIGSACWYKTSPGKGIPWKWIGGTLRAWSTNYEEFESGPGLYPVGVVEDNKTGCCHSVHVVDICFAAVPPSS